MVWDTRQLPVLLTTAQTAQLLGVTPHQVCKMCAAGKLPAARIGERKWAVKKAKLLEQLGLTE